MNAQDVIQSIYHDSRGQLRVDARPGYALLSDYLVSDLAGLGLGQYYQEVRNAALRGLDGNSSDEILGNAFAVEVTGETTTLTLLPRPDSDLRLDTGALLAALDQVATAVLERRSRLCQEPTGGS